MVETTDLHLRKISLFMNTTIEILLAFSIAMHLRNERINTSVQYNQYFQFNRLRKQLDVVHYIVGNMR